MKDHLGNVRVTIRPGYNNTPVVKQTDSYYPFGMKIAGLSSTSGEENGQGS